MLDTQYKPVIADLSSLDEARVWDSYVDQSRHSVNYHRSGWLEVVEKTFGHRIIPIWVRNPSGDVLGLLPLVFMQSRLFGRNLVSVPFFNYGGVLSEDEEVTRALLDKGEEILSECGADSLELRNIGESIDGLPTRTHKVTMQLPLPETADLLWKSFKPKVRNQVRKAEKSDLQVRIGGIELLNDFYDVFSENMRDLGTPVYSRKLFANVLNRFDGESALFTVYKDNRCVAGGLGIWYRGVFEIPWASSLRYFNRMCPNNLLYWQMLSHACKIGCSVFDFGRSTPDGGTYKFKKQWGAEPVQLFWQYILPDGNQMPEINPDNPKYRMVIKLWQKMPVFLTRLVGPHIVRSIP